MHRRMLRYGCVMAIVAALTLNAGFGPASLSFVKAQDKDDDYQEITPLAATAGSTIFALAVDPGLGAPPQRLISFDINAPGTLRGDVRISGLQAGEILKGIDFRPATGQLYALGSTSRLYTIDPTTAVATLVNGPFTPAVDPTNFFGFDFNPVPDRIRAIANVTDQNLRLNPNTGLVATTDPNVAYASTDPGAMDDLPPNIVAEAYSNNVAGATSTTNFAIDARPDGPARLVTLGTRDFPNSPPGGGMAVSPNTGQLFTVGNITVNNAVQETNNFAGFDIFDSDTAYVSLTPINPFNSTSSLYSLDLSTGAATLVGAIGGNVRVDSLTVAQSNMVTTTVQFSASTFTVAEGAGNIMITVTRTGDTNQPVTVEFQTDDVGDGIRCDTFTGTAFPRCDYSSENGTLSFAAGETSKSFTVFITDDGYAEGDETFTVSLRNVSLGGAINPQQGRATVTITDNDTATATTNPIDVPEFFVRQLYVDFLNREPDTAGFNAFVNTLRNCPSGDTSCDRVSVAQGFSRSDEYLLFKGYYSIRFYLAAFGRRPSYQEFIRDHNRLTGPTEEAVVALRAAFAEDFTVREEFRARYSSLNNAQFVDLLYRTAGITLTASAQSQIVADLNSGAKTRGQVLRDLIERQDFFNRNFNAGFVLTQYFGFLRRDPDEQGFQDHLRTLNNDPTAFRTVVINFVNSIEYRLRFGRP
ncbi:MAG: DUF4394 domain-containing protein [Pyrinomonadaceae bacterium]|nr:DUF4394 domain-containing protein [Pyrinomonadaceae bacterium]MDQ3585862.1 DUF4394 domain-containing protein [Acidobacteriota bacterium]